MEKKFYSALIAIVFLFSCLPGFSSNGLPLPTNFSLSAEICDAAPPDSFRITSIGSDFISLAWIPAWLGADHQLSVFKKNAGGGWDLLYIINSVFGANHTANNLQPGSEYRFKIATICGNGEVSYRTAIVDGIALIIDLAVNGRIPLNPVTVNCRSISLEHEWVGFKVACPSCLGAPSSLFEFTEFAEIAANNNFVSHVVIRRVETANPIVAVSEAGDWPNFFETLPNVWNPFRIDRLSAGGLNNLEIGFVRLTILSNGISLCADYNNPIRSWDNAYTFTALVAEAVAPAVSPDVRTEKNLLQNGAFRAQSPFKESLLVFIPSSNTGFDKTTFRLLNTSGQTVMEQHLESFTPQVSFPVEALPSGIYILRIEQESEIQTILVIKSE